jgi:hypothetical protein
MDKTLLNERIYSFYLGHLIEVTGLEFNIVDYDGGYHEGSYITFQTKSHPLVKAVKMYTADRRGSYSKALQSNELLQICSLKDIDGNSPEDDKYSFH